MEGVEIPNRCPECEELVTQSGSWFVWKTNHSGVVDGRLRINEVGVEFVLGCTDCSATILTVSADVIACNLPLSTPH